MKWSSSTYSRDTAVRKIENVLKRIGAFRALSDEEARSPAPANFLDGEPSAENLAAFHNEGLREAIGSARRYLKGNVKAVCRDEFEERLAAQALDAVGFMEAILHPAQFGFIWRSGRIPRHDDVFEAEGTLDRASSWIDPEKDPTLKQLKDNRDAVAFELLGQGIDHKWVRRHPRFKQAKSALSKQRRRVWRREHRRRVDDAGGGLSNHKQEFPQGLREDLAEHAQQWSDAEKCLVEFRAILRSPQNLEPGDENSSKPGSIQIESSHPKIDPEPDSSTTAELSPESREEIGGDRASDGLDQRDSDLWREGAWFEKATNGMLTSEALRQRKQRGDLPGTKKPRHRLCYCVREVCDLYPNHRDCIDRAIDRERRDGDSA